MASPKKPTAKKTAAKKPAAKKPAAKKPATKKPAAKKPAAKKPAAKKPAAKKPAANKPAAKKPAASRAPSVSPLRGMSIEAWISAKTSGWQSALVQTIIGVVRSAAPESEVSIKWGQPVFEQAGPFAFIRAAKAHVSVGFWRGAEVADPAGILERGGRMGHFKLTAASVLDEDALAAMVKDAVRMNLEKGSPTKRP
ncbi:MAG: DUF1801 domain-containing protein [Polyangiaceae bacterium]